MPVTPSEGARTRVPGCEELDAEDAVRGVVTHTPARTRRFFGIFWRFLAISRNSERPASRSDVAQVDEGREPLAAAARIAAGRRWRTASRRGRTPRATAPTTSATFRWNFPSPVDSQGKGLRRHRDCAFQRLAGPEPRQHREDGPQRGVHQGPGLLQRIRRRARSARKNGCSSIPPEKLGAGDRAARPARGRRRITRVAVPARFVTSDAYARVAPFRPPSAGLKPRTAHPRGDERRRLGGELGELNAWRSTLSVDLGDVDALRGALGATARGRARRRQMR